MPARLHSESVIIVPYLDSEGHKLLSLVVRPNSITVSILPNGHLKVMLVFVPEYGKKGSELHIFWAIQNQIRVILNTYISLCFLESELREHN
jgi:hypothetical protein